MAKKLPLISVVVCSLNGADVIYDALKAIKAQKWAGKLEIIVVDDGSTDDTYKIAKSFKEIKVIKNKVNLGTAKSRNIGIKAAKGEIIAFTDDDCRPRPTWIKELYAGYASDKVLAVAGEAISTDKSSITLRYLHINNPLKPLENKLLKSNKLTYRFGLYLKSLLGLEYKMPNRKRSVYAFATAVFAGIGYDLRLRKSNLLYLLRIISIRNSWNVGHKIFRSNPYDTYDAIGQHSDEFRHVMIENIHLETACKYFILKYVTPQKFKLDSSKGILAIELT